MTYRCKLCLLAFAAVLSLAGHVTPVSAQSPADCATPDDFSSFRQQPPRSILVLPPLNQSKSIEGPYSWLSTVSHPLAERGYYVFPVAVVDQLMKENGLPGAAEMHQVPPAKLREIIGADAVLYVVLHRYGSEFQLIDTRVSVSVSARLVDTKSGAELWKGHALAQQSSSGSGGSLLADLIGAAITQIVNSKTDPGHQVSRLANVLLFSTRKREIPPGPYLPAQRQKHLKESKHCACSGNETPAAGCT